MKSVADLRKEGFKIRVTVSRLPFEMGREMTTLARMGALVSMEDVQTQSVPIIALKKLGPKNTMWTFGGVTHMEVWTPERKDEEGASPDYEVTAVCSALDQFRKKVGHKICMNRLEMVMSGKYLDWPYMYDGHKPALEVIEEQE